MRKKKPAKKAPNVKLSVRMPPSWVDRLDDFAPKGKHNEFILMVLRPILEGRVEPVQEGDRIVRFDPITDADPVPLDDVGKRGRPSGDTSTEGDE